LHILRTSAVARDAPPSARGGLAPPETSQGACALMSTTPLRICFVDDQLEDAERLVSVLRNAGLAVRPNHARDVETLAELLSSDAPDLILAALSGPIGLADITDQIGKA